MSASCYDKIPHEPPSLTVHSPVSVLQGKKSTSRSRDICSTKTRFQNLHWGQERVQPWQAGGSCKRAEVYRSPSRIAQSQHCTLLKSGTTIISSLLWKSLSQMQHMWIWHTKQLIFFFFNGMVLMHFKDIRRTSAKIKAIMHQYYFLYLTCSFLICAFPWAFILSPICGDQRFETKFFFCSHSISYQALIVLWNIFVYMCLLISKWLQSLRQKSMFKDYNCQLASEMKT